MPIKELTDEDIGLVGEPVRLLTDEDIGLTSEPQQYEPETPEAPKLEPTTRSLGWSSGPAGTGALGMRAAPEVVEKPPAPSPLQPTVEFPKFSISETEPWYTAVPKEAANLAIGIPEFMTSQAGVAALAAPAVSIPAFTSDMAYSLGKQIYNLSDKAGEMTPTQLAVSLTDLGGTALMMAGGAKKLHEDYLYSKMRAVEPPMEELAQPHTDLLPKSTAQALTDTTEPAPVQAVQKQLEQAIAPKEVALPTPTETKGTENALPVKTANEVSLEPTPRDSGTLGEGVRPPVQEPPRTETKTEAQGPEVTPAAENEYEQSVARSISDREKNRQSAETTQLISGNEIAALKEPVRYEKKTTELPSKKTEIPEGMTYDQAQEIVDSIQEKLIDKYGVDAVVKADIPGYPQPIPESERKPLRDAYALRNAIDKRDVDNLIKKAQTRATPSEIFTDEAINSAIESAIREARELQADIFDANKKSFSKSDQDAIFSIFYYVLMGGVKNRDRRWLPEELRTYSIAKDVAESWPNTTYGISPKPHIQEAERIFKQVMGGTGETPPVSAGAPVSTTPPEGGAALPAAPPAAAPTETVKPAQPESQETPVPPPPEPAPKPTAKQPTPETKTEGGTYESKLISENKRIIDELKSQLKDISKQKRELRKEFKGVKRVSFMNRTTPNIERGQKLDIELGKLEVQESNISKQIGKLQSQIGSTQQPAPTPTPEPGKGKSIGPGAAAQIDPAFTEAATESRKGLWQRLADWIKSKRTPDNENIKVAIQRKDILPGRHWINSPEFLFRDDPIAGPFVTDLIEAQLRHNNSSGRDTVHFVELAKQYDEASLKRITKALRDYQAGDDVALTSQLNPKEQAFAEEMRTYFDQWKEMIRLRKVDNIINALPDARQRALKAVLDGMPLEESVKANKLRKSGQSAVELALKEIEEARQWGIENYVTNAEQGQWRIIDEEGSTIAIGETKTEAYQKAEDLIKANPNIGPLTLDDSFSPGYQWPSQLTMPAYGKLLKQMADSTGKTAKEMQEALRKVAPGIVLKPTSKYSRFLQKRRNILKGEENIMDVLPSYIYSMWKKYELDPVLKKGKYALSQMAPETRAAVQSLVDDVKGQKYLSDKIVDQLLSSVSDISEKTFGVPIPIKPFAFTRGVSTLRNISAHLKLGYRPISILINRIGGIHHTWTKTGFVDYLEGRKWIKTPEGKRIVEEVEAEIGLQSAFATEGRLGKEEPWYKPLGLFQKMEHFNRPEAFGAFYIQAVKRLGMDRESAIDYAKKETRFSQFIYSTGSIPRLLRIPTGKALLQFKTYLVKEAEFISSLKPAELTRYTIGFLALGGPRAAIMVIRSLPVIGAIGALGAIEQWLNEKVPAASRGVPGAAGVDVSAAVSPQLPSKADDWIGATVSDYFKLWTDVIKPALQGQSKDFGDLKNWASRAAPSIFYLTQATEAIMDENGWVTDNRGRKQFQASRWDKAKMALGVMPLQKSIESTERRYLLETEAIQRANRQHWLDNLVDAIQKNDKNTIKEMLKDSGDYYETTEDLNRAIDLNIKNRETPVQERIKKRLSKYHRSQIEQNKSYKSGRVDY